MARDWIVDETIVDIVRKVQIIAPDNQAAIPLNISFDDGQWHVDVMVKKPDCEYDVHAFADGLGDALKQAYKRLGNWRMLELNPDFNDEDADDRPN